jgi:hypothetical protein
LEEEVKLKQPARSLLQTKHLAARLLVMEEAMAAQADFILAGLQGTLLVVEALAVMLELAVLVGPTVQVPAVLELADQPEVAVLKQGL